MPTASIYKDLLRSVEDPWKKSFRSMADYSLEHGGKVRIDSGFQFHLERCEHCQNAVIDFYQRYHQTARGVRELVSA